MTRNLIDLAEETAANWINGNRTDALNAVKEQGSPFNAAFLAMQTAAFLAPDHEADWSNAIERKSFEAS